MHIVQCIVCTVCSAICCLVSRMDLVRDDRTGVAGHDSELSKTKCAGPCCRLISIYRRCADGSDASAAEARARQMSTRPGCPVPSERGEEHPLVAQISLFPVPCAMLAPESIVPCPVSPPMDPPRPACRMYLTRPRAKPPSSQASAIFIHRLTARSLHHPSRLDRRVTYRSVPQPNPASVSDHLCIVGLVSTTA